MRTGKTRVKAMWIVCVLAGLLASGLGASEAWAQGCWTTVGSTGSVDEQDLGIFEVVNSMIGIKSTVGVEVLDLCYNVVDEEMLHDGTSTSMTVRFRDNDAASYVNIGLRSVDLATGVESTILSFDSNAFPVAAGFQTRTVSVVTSGFDFTKKAYYLRVKIYKSNPNANPQLQAVRICRS